MPSVTKSISRFDREDVTFIWSGGRNITWRLTHGPTGISIEGSTNLTDANFTKKRLRVADMQLMNKLLNDLEKLVVQHERAVAG